MYKRRALRRELPADCAVVGYDFCEPMLDIGRVRAKQEGVALEFKAGDCMRLPIADASQDVVTIAYGVRNFEDRAKGLRELRRILRPDGTLLVLEFSQPSAWFAPFHFIHVRCVLPVLAGLLTGDFGAYKYLGTSIAGFPDAAGLDAELTAAGFAQVSHKRMLFGTVALHQARACKIPCLSGRGSFAQTPHYGLVVKWISFLTTDQTFGVRIPTSPPL